MSSTKTMPDEATLLTKVVVGSQLHGLANKDSDQDTRGVFIMPLEQVLSPFVKTADNYWLEGGDQDDTAYELRHFIKMCASGNPTALEVLWSDKIIMQTEAIARLYKHRHLLLDSLAVYKAHQGYANNQYKKMSFFVPDERTPKFAVAYIRSLAQGVQLLTTGDFEPRIENYDKDLAKFLRVVKYQFADVPQAELAATFTAWQGKLDAAFFTNANRFTIDELWLADYIVEIYQGHGRKLTKNTVQVTNAS